MSTTSKSEFKKTDAWKQQPIQVTQVEEMQDSRHLSVQTSSHLAPYKCMKVSEKLKAILL
jgi:hypothetical protein